jgi:hypothetical protein
MSAETKFVCSSGELVHTMLRLYLYRLLQWFISGGCQIYVLVPCWLPKLALVPLMAQHEILLNPQPGKVFFLCQGKSFIRQTALYITEIEWFSTLPFPLPDKHCNPLDTWSNRVSKSSSSVK